MIIQPVLKVENLTKSYHRGGQFQGLRQTLRKLIPSKGIVRPSEDIFFAVKEISFEVVPGEAFGIIGPNGAGKTTMLRLLSGITQPTSGRIIRPERIAAIIELGAGFHPELSGRENIYLYAAIMGMKRDVIKANFDKIVAFSELEDFLDMPLKHYSSGMYVRLAFSVAASIIPDVLLIDEVLTVGDAAFQTKSLRHIRELKEGGAAIVFVSHNLHQVRVLCDQAIFMLHGQVQLMGPAETVVQEYLNNPRYQKELQNTYQQARKSFQDTIAKEARIMQVLILDSDQQERTSYKTGEQFTVRIKFNAYQRIINPTFNIAFYSMDGTMYAGHQTNWDGVEIDHIEGEGYVDVIIDELTLPPGGFLLSVSISDSRGMSKYDWHQKAYALYVLVGKIAAGITYIPHHWELHLTDGMLDLD